MIKHNIVFIGLDTHKIPTEVVYIEGQRSATPVHNGKNKNNQSGNNEICEAISI